jgi:TM2 domain-containing membrane protein YozV
MYKIIGRDAQIYGPVAPEHLRRWIAEGRAARETLAQPEGAQDWRPLAMFPEFATDLVAPPPLVAGSAVAGMSTPKLAAGICGILLGGLGIHKFVLGYTGAGLTMLLISVLSCGMLYGVMHIIGLIEGIIYLTRSDDEFTRLYVKGGRTWF